MTPERRDKDFYPTTPCAAFALRDELQARGLPPQGRVLDPAAGAGTLLEWTGVPRQRRFALELRDDAATRESLQRYVPERQHLTGIDSLRVSWDFADTLIANPPFSCLDAFVLRCADFTERTGGMAIAMTPTQWWQAQSRVDYPKPALMLALSWRAPFTGKGGAPYDVVWNVFLPNAMHTEFAWLRKPAGARRGHGQEEAWAVFETIQPPQ